MAKLQAQAPQVDVYIDGALSIHARCLSATMTAGGQSLPSATVVIEPTLRRGARGRILNKFLAGFVQSEIEIIITGTNGPQVVHWGKVLANQSVLDQTGDAVIYTSRMEAHHFGDPLIYSYFWQPKDKKQVAVYL